MGDSTTTLVDRYLADDPSAFAELVARYYDPVFRLCYRMLGHRQDAEDATQETLVRLARNLHAWDPARPLEPWLLTIAGNRCRTALARRRPTRALTPAVEPACAADTEQARLAALQEEVARALAALRSEHRQALELFHREQLGYAEIARRLGCPVGTVKTWVHRARAELLEELRRRDALGDLGRAVQ